MNFYDAVEVISGGTPKTNIEEYWNGDIDWLSVVDFASSNKYVYSSEKHITQAGLENSSTKILKKGSIIISARGTVGKMAVLAKDMAFNQSCFGLCAIPSVLNQDYLFYYLTNYMQNILNKTQGSVFKTINLNTFKMIELELPILSEQEKIASVLSNIDNKIELNKSICSDLEMLAKEIYDYWFIQFDFPNENGKPYKSSGGKMVWNEALHREIPQGWTVKSVADYLDIITGKEDANFSTNDGLYPFFTCSNNVLKCDIPKYKGKSILIAGNGDFNVKYYDGEFNAYQRTYILIPNDDKYVGVIYQSVIRSIDILKRSSVGSIVKFITKSDVENIKVIEPNENGLYDIFNTVLNEISQKTSENRELKKLRDFLLPMLMNGQIKIEA